MKNLSKIINGFYRLASRQGMFQNMPQEAPEAPERPALPEGWVYNERGDIVRTEEESPRVLDANPPTHEKFENIPTPYSEEYWEALEATQGGDEEEARKYVEEQRIIDNASIKILTKLRDDKFAYKPDLVQLTIDGESGGVWFLRGNEYKPVKSHSEVKLSRSVQDKSAGIMKYFDDKLSDEKDPMIGDPLTWRQRLLGKQYPDVVSLISISHTVGDHESGEWVFDGGAYRKVNLATPLEISLL